MDSTERRLAQMQLADLAVKIVDDDSATLGHPHEVKQWLPANHVDMCGFDDRNCVAYRRVCGAIVELIDDTLGRLADSATAST